MSQESFTTSTSAASSPISAPPPSSAPPSTNPDNVNLTLNHINKLLAGVTLAQSRGAYTFDDSADLADTVKLVTKFIKISSEQAQQKASS